MRPVSERSWWWSAVRTRSSSGFSMRSCSRASRLSTPAHCRQEGAGERGAWRPKPPAAQALPAQTSWRLPQVRHRQEPRPLPSGALTSRSRCCLAAPAFPSCPAWPHRLTLRSPAVMFCSAPAAASVVCRLSSQRCSSRLYSPTIWGLHNHSRPLGSLDTSAKVRASAVRGSWAGEHGGLAEVAWDPCFCPPAPVWAHLSEPPALWSEAAHRLARGCPHVLAAPALQPLKG